MRRHRLEDVDQPNTSLQRPSTPSHEAVGWLSVKDGDEEDEMPSVGCRRDTPRAATTPGQRIGFDQARVDQDADDATSSKSAHQIFAENS